MEGWKAKRIHQRLREAKIIPERPTKIKLKSLPEGPLHNTLSYSTHLDE